MTSSETFCTSSSDSWTQESLDIKPLTMKLEPLSFLEMTSPTSSPEDIKFTLSRSFREPSTSSSTSSESSSSSSTLDIKPFPLTRQKCAICPRTAYCTNYGVVTCDACKMFFRRIVVLKRDYKCKKKHECWPIFQKCKACRYQQCLDAGMSYIPTFLEMRNEKDDDVAKMIVHLMFLDSRRCEKMKNWFTMDDFSLKEVVENRGMRLEQRTTDLSTHDWSFLGIYTSIEFLMGVQFMENENLPIGDKISLLKNFSVKASLFSSAMRAVREKRDRLMTVDGKDVYPDGLRQLDKFSDDFLNRIRSLLVTRIIDLRITHEEYVLITAIFFCNPALITLSDTATPILTSYQKKYSSALLQYCMYTYQQSGPSRFTDLLSLCHVINRNFEDVQYMTMIFRFYQRDVVYRKIVSEVI